MIELVFGGLPPQEGPLSEGYFAADKPRRLQLKLDVSEANIDELERQSCEEIFLAREREYQDSYRHIPALDELAARYGDTTTAAST